MSQIDKELGLRMNYFGLDDGLGPENTSVTFGAIILNGLTVIAFTRQVSAADADRSEIHSSPATLRGGYNNNRDIAHYRKLDNGRYLGIQRTETFQKTIGDQF